MKESLRRIAIPGVVTMAVVGLTWGVSTQVGTFGSHRDSPARHVVQAADGAQDEQELAEALLQDDNIVVVPYTPPQGKHGLHHDTDTISSATAISNARAALPGLLDDPAATATLVSFTDNDEGVESTPDSNGVTTLTRDYVAVPAWAVTFSDVAIPTFGGAPNDDWSVQSTVEPPTGSAVVFVDAYTGEALVFETVPSLS